MFYYTLQLHCLNRIMNISVRVHYRLIAEQGEELAVDRLSKELKTLAKQIKATKYREVMKLLRLVLSGLQVPEDIKFICIIDSNINTYRVFCQKLV